MTAATGGRLGLVTLGALGLGGCAVAAAMPAGEGGSPVAVARIHVSPAAPAAARGLRLLAQRAPWDEQALASGVVQVWLRTAGEAAPGRAIATLPGTRRDLTLTNLRRDQTYTVLLRGWLDVPTPQGVASTQISVDADSIATFDTLPSAGHYLTVRNVDLRLHLADQTFAGQSQSTTAITEGQLVDTPATERLAP